MTETTEMPATPDDDIDPVEAALDEAEWDESPPHGGNVVEWIANLTAGAVLISEPSGAGIMVANSLEKLAKAVTSLDQRAWERRAARRLEVLRLTAEDMGVDPEQLVDRVAGSDARTELMGRTLEAADSTLTYEEKLKALSKALAAGLTDDAKIDETAAQVKILAELETAHVRALAALYDRAAQPRRPNPKSGSSYPGQRKLKAGKYSYHPAWMTLFDLSLSTGLHYRESSVLTVLTSLGLTREEIDRSEEAATLAAWQITPYGVAILKLLDYDKIVGDGIKTESWLDTIGVNRGMVDYHNRAWKRRLPDAKN